MDDSMELLLLVLTATAKEFGNDSKDFEARITPIIKSYTQLVEHKAKVEILE